LPYLTAPPLARPARAGEPGFSQGGRIYENPRTGATAVSITSVTKVKAKPAVEAWQLKKCGEYAADNIVELHGLLSGKEAAELEAARKQAVDLVRQAPDEHTSKASSNGDLVHDAIDALYKTGELPDTGSWSLTAKRMFRAFLKWNERYKPEYVDSEFTVWSEKYGYAGTADLALIIAGYLALIDSKTGNGTYPEVGLQLAALANADYIINPDGSTRPLPRFERFAVLHIRPTYVDLEPINYIDHCFTAFRALRNVRWWDDYVALHVIGTPTRTESPLKEAS
jgi:hypothetical protein